MKKKEILKRHLVVRISEKQANSLLASLGEKETNISELVRRIIKDYNNKKKIE
ncbi:MAG: hypothetical protein WCG93_06405 [Paludibacter sp.]